jgi:hypothetical protein
MTEAETALQFVNPNNKGFGKPSELTQRLVAMGWIELTSLENGIWFASLTKAGKTKKLELFSSATLD